jgi:hypothetical protein
MARGRPQVPDRPSFGGDPIVGLYRCPDGRWRINATGDKFTERDEHRAIARFRQWEAEHKGQKPLFTVPAAKAPIGNGEKVALAIRTATGRDDVEYAPIVDHDGTVGLVG